MTPIFKPGFILGYGYSVSFQPSDRLVGYVGVFYFYNALGYLPDYEIDLYYQKMVYYEKWPNIPYIKVLQNYLFLKHFKSWFYVYP